MQETEWRLLLKMKIKYELESSGFFNEEEVRHLLEKAKKSEDTMPEEFGKLAREAVVKAEPAIREIATRFTNELSNVIAEVTFEASIELITSKIKEILKNQG